MALNLTAPFQRPFLLSLFVIGGFLGGSSTITLQPLSSAYAATYDEGYSDEEGFVVDQSIENALMELYKIMSQNHNAKGFRNAFACKEADLALIDEYMSHLNPRDSTQNVIIQVLEQVRTNVEEANAGIRTALTFLFESFSPQAQNKLIIEARNQSQMNTQKRSQQMMPQKKVMRQTPQETRKEPAPAQELSKTQSFLERKKAEAKKESKSDSLLGLLGKVVEATVQ